MRQTFTTIAGMALLFFTTANTFATPWIQETRLVASDGDHEDRFGESVSISGDGKTVLVGAHFNDDNGNNSGTAYIKERIGGIWYETKLVASDGQSNDRFGGSVSISEDGNTQLLGQLMTTITATRQARHTSTNLLAVHGKRPKSLRATESHTITSVYPSPSRATEQLQLLGHT